LSLTQISALRTNGRRPRGSARLVRAEPHRYRSEDRFVDAERDAYRICEGMVRRGPARSDDGCEGAPADLVVQLPEDVLRRSVAAARRQQQSGPERGDAARALRASGPTARGMHTGAHTGGEMRAPWKPGVKITEEKCGQLVVDEGPCRYDAAAFDQAVKDIVNFLH